MNYNFSDVSERDMDLLFLEEFTFSDTFMNIFLSKIGIDNAELIEFEHSKTDVAYGESDITVIVNHNGKKTALLIEDKIDARAMDEQYSRYVCRGDLGIQNKEYDDYFVFIVAPSKYLSENDEAKKYPYKVSYEECLDYFKDINDKRAEFKIQQMQSAISKQKNGYKPVISEEATKFWNNYIRYQNEHFKSLEIIGDNALKPVNSTWIIFRTNIEKARIIHKTEMGFVDLEFSGLGNKINELHDYLFTKLDEVKRDEVGIFKTGKSAVIRIEVPVICFKTDFEKDQAEVEKCLKAVVKLRDLSFKIPINIVKIMNELF